MPRIHNLIRTLLKQSRQRLLDIPFLVLAGSLFAFYLAGLPDVPFHPDESTQLFMSGDFEQFWKDPFAMAWDGIGPEDPRERYRLLDAPLTRYLLGLGRFLAGQPAPFADWNWSESWIENDRRGALPSQDLLRVARLAVAVLFPCTLFLIYWSGSSIAGRFVGLLAALLLGTNALVLLHTRRAMAEGALLLGVCAFLAALSHARRYPWLAGLAIALAFNAKQSALPMLPAGLLAVAWSPDGLRSRPAAQGDRPADSNWRLELGSSTRQLALYLGAFIFVTLALNPTLWKRPFQAARAAAAARQEFTQRQVEEVKRLASAQLLENPGERLIAHLAHLYLAPPMFSEAGNYRQETAAAEAEYLKNRGHNLLRNYAGGAFLLGATLLGLYHAGRSVWENRSNRRTMLLYLFATLSQVGGLISTVPLPWQRYTLPLVPFACLWAGLGLSRLTILYPFIQRSISRLIRQARNRLSYRFNR